MAQILQQVKYLGIVMVGQDHRLDLLHDVILKLLLIRVFLLGLRNALNLVAKVIYLLVSVELELRDQVIQIILTLDHLVRYHSVLQIIDLHLELLLVDMAKLSAQCNLVSFHPVAGGLVHCQLLLLLFDLGVHLLRILLVLLYSLYYFIFKNLHASLKLIDALGESRVRLLGAVALTLVAHQKELRFKIFLFLVEVSQFVLSALARLY